MNNLADANSPEHISINKEHQQRKGPIKTITCKEKIGFVHYIQIIKYIKRILNWKAKLELREKCAQTLSKPYSPIEFTN